MAESLLLITMFLGALIISLPGLATIAMWCSRTPRPIRIWHFITRGLLLIALFSMLWIVLPKSKAIFIGFGTECPSLTLLWLQISDLAVSHFVTFSLCVALSLTAESVVFERSLRSNNSDDLFFPKLCSTLVTGVWVILAVFSTISVFMPTVKILNDLS